MPGDLLFLSGASAGKVDGQPLGLILALGNKVPEACEVCCSEASQSERVDLARSTFAECVAAIG